MRIGRWLRLAVAAAPLAVAGCGNFWQAPSTSTSGCTGSSCSTTTDNFYVLNQGTQKIAEYTLSSGTVTAISGSPIALGAAPVAMTVDPSGSYLYIATVSGIYLYDINSTTGALTVGFNGQPIEASVLATTMQVDPSGSWLVWSNSAESSIGAIPLDTSTGEPTGGNIATANLPGAANQLVVSPDNGYVFVAMGTAGTEIIPFTLSNSNPFDTNITNIKVKNTGGQAISVAVDGDTRVFYVGETLGNSSANSGGIRVFNYSSLTASNGLVENDYASGGLKPTAILPAGTTNYVYVANWATGGNSAGNIAAFTVETSTGSSGAYTLTAGTSIATGINPVALAVDSSDAYVLAVNMGGNPNKGGNPDLEGYTIGSTGALTSAFSQATGTDPVTAAAIAVQ